MTGFEASVHLKVGAQPRAYPARPVPLPLQAAVTDELDRLVRMDILEPVEPTETPIQWATPIVPVIKANGQVCVCGDFKLTLNKWVQTDNYPLPRFEDIVAKLNGSQVFSVIDLRDAYLQIPIAPGFRGLFTIATHKGYFRYKRLPFGRNFAPALFQRTMDKVLSGLPSTGAYLDDVDVVVLTLVLICNICVQYLNVFEVQDYVHNCRNVSFWSHVLHTSVT